MLLLLLFLVASSSILLCSSCCCCSSVSSLFCVGPLVVTFLNRFLTLLLLFTSSLLPAPAMISVSSSSTCLRLPCSLLLKDILILFCSFPLCLRDSQSLVFLFSSSLFHDCSQSLRRVFVSHFAMSFCTSSSMLWHWLNFSVPSSSVLAMNCTFITALTFS